jgi:hypothetical protein
LAVSHTIEKFEVLMNRGYEKEKGTVTENETDAKAKAEAESAVDR